MLNITEMDYWRRVAGIIGVTLTVVNDIKTKQSMKMYKG